MRASGRVILALVCSGICPCSSVRMPANPGGKAGSSLAHAAAAHSLLDPWTYNPLGGRVPVAPLLPAVGSAECSAMYGHENLKLAPPEWTKWHFAPPGAWDWRRFDGPTLCRALLGHARAPRQARMLFVGDSMSRDQMHSLLLLMGGFQRSDRLKGRKAAAKRWPEDDRAYHQQEDGGPSKDDGALACDQGLWVQQFGSRDLVADYANKFRLEDHLPWLHSFDVVVLEIPWQVPPERGVRFWKASVLPHQRVLFRTPTIGHEHSGVSYASSWDGDVSKILKSRPHSAPLQSPEEIIEVFGRQKGHLSWLGKRKSTEAMISELGREGFAVADFYYLTAMMWYHHLNPLHYCVPGPLDTWNEVVFNWIVRGHLRDFQDWSLKFSQAVSHLGGMHNEDGVAYMPNHKKLPPVAGEGSKPGGMHNEDGVAYMPNHRKLPPAAGEAKA